MAAIELAPGQILFREGAGQLGLVEQQCCHRGASLEYARVEEDGIRCAYHGWKFDVTARCVDMMNEPEELSFKQKIRQPSYPTVEIGGLVWTYMGPPDREPPLPKFAWTQSPATRMASSLSMIGMLTMPLISEVL